jgi:hypothetical protein
MSQVAPVGKPFAKTGGLASKYEADVLSKIEGL